MLDDCEVQAHIWSILSISMASISLDTLFGSHGRPCFYICFPVWLSPSCTWSDNREKKNLFPSPWPKVAGSISITISISISIGICIRKYQLLLALAFIRDSSSHRHTCTSLFPPKGRKKSISTLEIAFRGDSLPPPCYPPGSMFAFWPSKKAGQSWDQIVSVLQPIHRPVHSNHTYEGLWRSYKYQTLGDILPRLKVELIFFWGGGALLELASRFQGGSYPHQNANTKTSFSPIRMAFL